MRLNCRCPNSPMSSSRLLAPALALEAASRSSSRSKCATKIVIHTFMDIYGQIAGSGWLTLVNIKMLADNQPIRRSSTSRQLTISQGSPSWPHDDMDSRLMMMTMIGWWMVIMMTIMKSNFILMIQTMVFWLPGFLTGERGNLQFRDEKKARRNKKYFKEVEEKNIIAN